MFSACESEYRRELETDIEPFKGLLLGLFFIAVGMSIDFAVLAASLWKMLAVVLALLGLKALAIAWLAESSLRSGRTVLEVLGVAQADAERHAERFREHNLALFEQMYARYQDKDRAGLIAVARQGREQSAGGRRPDE